jgi:hypothetical protein
MPSITTRFTLAILFIFLTVCAAACDNPNPEQTQTHAANQTSEAFKTADALLHTRTAAALTQDYLGMMACATPNSQQRTAWAATATQSAFNPRRPHGVPYPYVQLYTDPHPESECLNGNGDSLSR